MLQYNNLFFNFQKHGVQWNHEKDLQNISRSYCNNWELEQLIYLEKK